MTSKQVIINYSYVENLKEIGRALPDIRHALAELKVDVVNPDDAPVVMVQHHALKFYGAPKDEPGQTFQIQYRHYNDRLWAKFDPTRPPRGQQNYEGFGVVTPFYDYRAEEFDGGKGITNEETPFGSLFTAHDRLTEAMESWADERIVIEGDVDPRSGHPYAWMEVPEPLYVIHAFPEEQGMTPTATVSAGFDIQGAANRFAFRADDGAKMEKFITDVWEIAPEHVLWRDQFEVFHPELLEAVPELARQMYEQDRMFNLHSAILWLNHLQADIQKGRIDVRLHLGLADELTGRLIETLGQQETVFYQYRFLRAVSLIGQIRGVMAVFTESSHNFDYLNRTSAALDVLLGVEEQVIRHERGSAVGSPRYKPLYSNERLADRSRVAAYLARKIVQAILENEQATASGQPAPNEADRTDSAAMIEWLKANPAQPDLTDATAVVFRRYFNTSSADLWLLGSEVRAKVYKLLNQAADDEMNGDTDDDDDTVSPESEVAIRARLAEIEARHQEASGGEWRVEQTPNHAYLVLIPSAHHADESHPITIGWGTRGKADAHFIAQAKMDIAYLLELVREIGVNSKERGQLLKLTQLIYRVPLPIDGTGMKSASVAGFVAFSNDMRIARKVQYDIMMGVLAGNQWADVVRHAPDVLLTALELWVNDRSAQGWTPVNIISPEAAFRPYIEQALIVHNVESGE